MTKKWSELEEKVTQTPLRPAYGGRVKKKRKERERHVSIVPVSDGESRILFLTPGSLESCREGERKRTDWETGEGRESG